MKKRESVLVFVLLFFLQGNIFAGLGAGTAVSSGGILIPIEQLQVGDLVDCCGQDAKSILDSQDLGLERSDELQPRPAELATGAQRYTQKAVTCKQSHMASEYLVLVVGEQHLALSPDQKLYLPERQEWVVARNCAAGDLLLGRHGVVSIDYIFWVEEPITFFDITVQDCHNFLVLPDGILVHNILPVFVGISAAFGGGIVADWCLTAGIAGIAAIGVKFAKEKYSARHDVKIITGPMAGSGSPGGPDDDERKKRAKKQEALTNKEAREMANKLGFKETKNAPFNSHGQLKFQKGDLYITVDKTCHKGGVWKMMSRSGKRLGTWNIDLTVKIGG